MNEIETTKPKRKKGKKTVNKIKKKTNEWKIKCVLCYSIEQIERSMKTFDEFKFKADFPNKCATKYGEIAILQYIFSTPFKILFPSKRKKNVC